MSFPLKLIPKIVVGQMALQITRVVKDPNNIDHGFASAAVDQKMSRLFDYAQVTPGPIAAEEQVIRSDAPRQIPPLLRSGTLWIGRDVTKRLIQKTPVTRGCAFTELILAPYQRFTDISLCGRGQNDSHVACRVQARLPFAASSAEASLPS